MHDVLLRLLSYCSAVLQLQRVRLTVSTSKVLTNPALFFLSLDQPVQAQEVKFRQNPMAGLL